MTYTPTNVVPSIPDDRNGAVQDARGNWVKAWRKT